MSNTLYYTQTPQFQELYNCIVGLISVRTFVKITDDIPDLQNLKPELKQKIEKILSTTDAEPQEKNYWFDRHCVLLHISANGKKRICVLNRQTEEPDKAKDMFGIGMLTFATLGLLPLTADIQFSIINRLFPWCSPIWKTYILIAEAFVIVGVGWRKAKMIADSLPKSHYTIGACMIKKLEMVLDHPLSSQLVTCDI